MREKRWKERGEKRVLNIEGSGGSFVRAVAVWWFSVLSSFFFVVLGPVLPCTCCCRCCCSVLFCPVLSCIPCSLSSLLDLSVLLAVAAVQGFCVGAVCSAFLEASPSTPWRNGTLASCHRGTARAAAAVMSISSTCPLSRSLRLV